jgi:hypothetical protein
VSSVRTKSVFPDCVLRASTLLTITIASDTSAR